MPTIDESVLNNIDPIQGGQNQSAEEAKEEVTQAIGEIDDEYPRYFDFQQANSILKQLVDDFGRIKTETESNRKVRKIEINIDEQRSLGRIGQNETFIPVRVIDSNIKREQPPVIKYLKTSRRLAVFKDPLEPTFVTDRLEEAFTDGVCYENWERDFYKWYDGAQAHGWDWMEVVYDKSRLFRVGFEHIGHDKLIFPLDAIDIQNCPRILREYDATLLTLKKFVKKYGFNKTEVDKILFAYKNRRDKTIIKIYKVFFKYDDIVYVAWCCFESAVSDWLLAPRKLFLGISHQELIEKQQMVIDQLSGVGSLQPIQVPEWKASDINLYPVIFLPYAQTEEDEIVAHKGRVFYDEYKQEALTSVTTGYVNGVNRASEVFAAISGDDPGGNLQVMEELSGNTVLSRPINFFHTDYPDPSVISGLQFLEAQNQQETGQVAWAVNNRKDSRKTAREISAATEQSAELDSVQLTLFSTSVRQIVTLAWQIVQSLALQGQIVIVPVEGSNGTMNDPAFIARNYIVKAGGDVDVIERGEKLQKMLTLWPIVAQISTLAPTFLINILKIAFPDDSAIYEQLLQMGNQQNAVLQQMYQLMSAMQDDMMKMMPDPKTKQNFQNLMMAAGQMLNAPQQPNSNSAGQSPQSPQSPQQQTQPQQ